MNSDFGRQSDGALIGVKMEFEVQVRVVTEAFFLAFILAAVQGQGSDTYHVALLRLDPTSAASVQILTTDTAAEAHTQQANCETLEINTEMDMSNKPCVSSLFPQSTEVETRGIRIENVQSADNVHVNIKNNGVDEGFLAIPDKALGTEYYVATFCRFGGRCQFSVTPVEDETSVMVYFPTNVNGTSVCLNQDEINTAYSVELPFLLDEYDVLYIESLNDLTGTYITSNNRIAVFSGATGVTSAHGPEAHMIEQLLPVNRWGTKFYAVPNIYNPAGDEFLILASTGSTKIDIAGFSPFIIPSAGQFVTRRIDNRMFAAIVASNPVLVIQLMSVDIYNDSTSVSGHPAMLTVQSEDHFKSDYSFKCGDDPCFSGNAFAAVVVDDSDQFESSAIDVPSSWDSVMSVVSGTDYMVVGTSNTSSSSSDPAISSGGGTFGMFVYTSGGRANLISQDWDYTAQVCSTTVAIPGDGVDNDCDGMIDEEECTEQDLTYSFTLASNIPNSTSTGGLDSIVFRIISCDVVFVSLKEPDPLTSYVLIEMVPWNAHAHYCNPDCVEENSVEASLGPGGSFDCSSDEKTYWISWGNPDFINIGLGETIDIDTKKLSLPLGPNSFTGMIDTISFSSPESGAQVTVDLPTKDCGKIITGGADNRGTRFLVPVTNTDPNADFNLMITPTGNGPVNVTITTLSGDGLYNMIYQGHTLVVEKPHFTAGINYEGVVVTTTGEVTVYVVQKLTGMTGYHVLPTDILGPAFSTTSYNDAAIDHKQVFMTMGHEVNIKATDEADFNIPENTIHERASIHGSITASSPVAVFTRQNAGKIWSQIPPVETLGSLYYVPPIDLTLLETTGQLKVTATEDSTYVVIKGTYDEGHEIVKRGQVVYRTLDSDTLMSVESSKPVLLTLHLDGSGSWAVMLTIPTTEQYKSHHYFPGFDSSYTFEASSAVNKDGEIVTSKVDSDVSQLQDLTYGGDKTFSITFIKGVGSPFDVGRYAIKSDEKLGDINKVCVLSKATTGDGKDNDCDGLTDEEFCYSVDTPGLIDYDIDGEFNEDCIEEADSYQASLVSFIDTSTIPITCSSPATVTVSPSSNTGATSGGTPNAGSGSSSTPPTPATSGDTLPVVTFPAGPPVVQIVTNTTNGTTSAAATVTEATTTADENCLTDCICPCGWVEVQNYTAEELQELVVERQQKLKIDKAILSAQKRKKTSASDNRPTAVGIGYVALAFLVCTIGSLFLLDLTSLGRDLGQLRANLRDMFAQ